MNKFLPSTIVIVTAFLLASCFHKSDKTGSADDITHSFICHTASGDYLITHEEIFHATSKSSGPKGSYTSGYADYRFTVRNIQTGEQVSRVITGDRDEDVMPIGYDGKQLWCYSADKSVGLHAREPSTMQITITRDKVEEINPFLRNSMDAPKVYEASQFYMYDPVSNTVVLTDIQGNLFSLDPASLKASPLKKKPSYRNTFADSHSTSADRWLDMPISLKGDIRKQIEFKHDKTSEDSYLNGEILLEQSIPRLSSVAKQMQEENNNETAKLQHRVDSFLSVYPALKDDQQASLTIRDYNIPIRFSELKRQLKSRQEDTGSMNDDIVRELNHLVMGCDSNYIYIVHANNLTDTSSILITRTMVKGETSHPQWTTLVPQIYFDPSKGIKRNSMSEVFKSGNPEFRYEWYGIEGNVLVGIKMLFAFGIDVNTGKLLWKQQL